MSNVLVYATDAHAAQLRPLLAQACRATGLEVQLELFSSGSLFQRLRTRRVAPPPDVVLWFGPYAAHAAAQAGLLQGYQPTNLPERAVHEAEWRWVAVNLQPWRVDGGALSGVDALGEVPRLALPDPERSEVGLAMVVAVLDRARQAQGDTEQGWAWWQRRMQSALLVEDEAGAADALGKGRASHALGLQTGMPVAGLAPLPHAISVPNGSRNLEAARGLIDWLVGPAAAVPNWLNAWQAQSNGLQTLLDSAPPLDVTWATSQYVATRRRWAQSGYGPTLTLATT